MNRNTGIKRCDAGIVVSPCFESHPASRKGWVSSRESVPVPPCRVIATASGSVMKNPPVPGIPKSALCPVNTKAPTGISGKVDGNVTGGLGSVNDEKNIIGMEVFRDRPDILNGPEHIAPVRHDNEPRIFADCLFYRGRILPGYQ